MSSLSPDLPRAYGGPSGCGTLKLTPDDFQVEECLGFEPEGEGEHVFLWVEKKGRNTDEVAGAIARFSSVAHRQVSYAGLKDKHALTRQWFSVHYPGKAELSWGDCRGEGYRVLRWTRNRRKLKRGALSGNRFNLRIRDYSGDRHQVEGILVLLGDQGMPNYFGPQRFGHQAGNLTRAKALLMGKERPPSRHRKGLYLSAARALIFNQVLSIRMVRGDWQRPVPGDLLMFDGGGAYFRAETLDEDIVSRVAAMKIHPSGPLWGRGGDFASLDAGDIERQAARCWPEFALGLERMGLKPARRALRVRVTDLAWSWEGKDLRLEFALPAGSYATTLLNELMETGKISDDL